LQYKKANHHCYALSLSKHHEVIEKSHDDGEVGHPGKVLLQLLKSHGFDHHLIMVSRIFGGIKLGVGGVTKAFKNAAKATITYYQSQR
jgi:putative IMPACT (imprinted ancient) family translation regulator